MVAEVDKILETWGRMQQEKAVWNTHWQLVHEYVLQRKADFTASRESGAFLHSEVWTAIPAKAAETAASALLGMIWPNSNSFKLKPVGELEDDEDAAEWFEDVSEIIANELDNPKAGLSLALGEFFLDLTVSGTPALHLEQGEESLYQFDAWNVQQFALDEGAGGNADTFFRCRKYTVRQAVEKFGAEKVSKKTREAFNKQRFTDDVEILHVIAPRIVMPNRGGGSKNMPFMSAWIEVSDKHLIKESGYQELPTYAMRYSKRIGEKYGRSMAMNALPDIMELNALWEQVTIGLEKNFDPPLAVWNDGVFGGGTIDTGAGAINVVNVSGKLPGTRAPIEPLLTVGNFNDVAVLIERLESTVNDHFMIDRLLDFNNETQMTAREALMRRALRASLLHAVNHRAYTEVFTPMLERAFNIGLRAGKFGYAAKSPEAIAWQAMNPGREMKEIPDSIIRMQGKGDRVYTIEYQTPAMREQRAEEAQGVLNLFEALPLIAQVDPSAINEVHGGRAVKVLGESWSVPHDVWMTDDEKEAKQQADAQVAQENRDMQVSGAQSEIAKNVASAQGEIMKGRREGAA